MSIDLSICQEALNRDPVLYLDLTEAVRRGEGRLLAATPRGALAAFHNYEKDGQDLGFTMFADDLETAQALLALIPPKPTFITVHEALYRDELEKLVLTLQGDHQNENETSVDVLQDSVS